MFCHRQGDPISPYLFIICMERLYRTIDQVVLRKDWLPISTIRGGPKISHIFFVDDLTLFARANRKNCDTILASLEDFNVASGQKVNFQKSKVIFSANCKEDWAIHCYNMIGIRKSTEFGKYLKFPIFHKRPNNMDFQFIIDNINTKLAGWKTKFLNMVGRTTLAKASLGSIPSYVIQYKVDILHY